MPACYSHRADPSASSYKKWARLCFSSVRCRRASRSPWVASMTCSSGAKLVSAAAPKSELVELFIETLARLDPAERVRRALRENDVVGDAVTVLALGKAAVPMAEAACAYLGPRMHSAVVVAPDIPPGKPAGWMASSHPVPTEQSERAGRALLAAAARAPGHVLALISGGGSSLAAVPAPGLQLSDKAALVASVYAAGADIAELNTLRKHLSAIKGGGLARVAPGPMHSLYLSDVVGDSLDVIASGPTISNDAPREQAVAIARKYLGASASGAAIDYLLGPPRETGRPEAPRHWSADTHVLLAGMEELADQAHAVAVDRGLQSHRMPRFEGSVDQVARAKLDEASGPGLWVSCGEATLALPARPGRGGRAQHLALTMAMAIRGRPDIEILVAGSDGVDGNSDAAGALVDGQTVARIEAAALDPARALRECNSDPVLAAIGAQIVTGPTQVNHADIILMRVW
jgi:glycerate 2-kinase